MEDFKNGFTSICNKCYSIYCTIKRNKKSTIAYSNRKEDLKADTLELSTKEESNKAKGAIYLGLLNGKSGSYKRIEGTEPSRKELALEARLKDLYNQKVPESKWH